ncbi:MAG: hypothetical protein L0Z53_16510, partial [Acidobacteriales bacterium]|nr:hypothetical protein [Terriglobales bacterium]
MLDLLALVPDNEFARSDVVYYQDFRAVENARNYLSRPESGAAFLASDPSLGFTQRWYAAPDQVRSGFFPLLEEMPATVGFDFFDINHTLVVAAPPAMTVIWSGDFDLDAIAAAHGARGFQQAEINGVPAWCGEAGCDSGMQQNIRNVEHGNLFDPAIGRQVPFLIFPDTLVSSSALEMLEAIADASQENMPSLLDAPEYRTLAEAITDNSAYSGELVSALVFPTEATMMVANLNDPISLVPMMEILRIETQEELEQLVNALADFVADYGTLPPYQLAAMADRQEGDQQVAVIALAYESAEDAELAAPELARRLESFSNFLVTRSDDPLLNLFPSTSIEARVYTSAETGFSAVVVEVRYPTPSQEEEQAPLSSPNEGPPRNPAAFYRYLV